MSDTSFSNIKRPDEFVEIGQPTYVELISVKPCEISPAIRKSLPGPSDSLRRVAFGKPCTSVYNEYGDTTVAQLPINVLKIGHEKPVKQAFDIRQATINSEFRDLVRNIDVVKYDASECGNGYTQVSYDDFSTDPGRINRKWAPGGIIDTVNGWLMTIPPRDNYLYDYQPANTIIRRFDSFKDGLRYGDKVKLTFEVVDYQSYFNHRTNFQVKFYHPFSPTPLLDVILDSEPGIKGSNGELEVIIPTPDGASPLDPSQPYAIVEIQIINIGNLSFPSGSPGSEHVPIDNILVCKQSVEGQSECQGTINNVKVLFEWNGIPRNPVNIFSCIINYTIRSKNPPYENRELRYYPTSEGRLSLIGCDLWKSQSGSGRAFRDNAGYILEVNEDDIINISSKSDWVWAIPQNNNNQIHDYMIVNFPDCNSLVESIEVFFLVNNIEPIEGTDTTPVYPPPLKCAPDPATGLNISIKYLNSKGLDREFTYLVTDFYTQEVSFTGTKWDTDYIINSGIKGSMAKWQSVKFNIDMLDGSGLDQCTNPDSVIFVASGVGNLSIINPKMSSSGNFSDSCDAEVLIDDIASGPVINEIQSIELPNPSGGTWDLSFTKNGVTRTTTLPWNTTAEQIRVRLSELPNIGSPKNLKVTGNGNESNPFLVEFIGDLSGTDHELLTADGSNLISVNGQVSVIQSATRDEIQTVTFKSDNPNVSINRMRISSRRPPFQKYGQYMQYPISLNDLQLQLEQLIYFYVGNQSPGVNNISVTAGIDNNISIDRDIPFGGPYSIEFINGFSNTNMGQIFIDPAYGYTPGGDVAPNSTGFVIKTLVDGGIGRNQIQRIIGPTPNKIGYSFKVRIYNQAGYHFDVLIEYNSNGTVGLKDFANSIVNAPGSFLGEDDFKITWANANANANIWDIELGGGINETSSFRATNLPLMEILSESGSDIVVKEAQKGSGVNNKQRITISRANGGSFKLTVTMNGVDYTTAAIPWNTTIVGLESQLLTLPPFEDGDLTITKLPKTDSKQNLRATITFKKKFGDIPLILADFQNTLLCNPIVLPIVPPPPPLQIPDCVENLGCSSGPLLCKPSFEDDDQVINCCDNETISSTANFSTRIKIERDLLDPRNGRTIKELAAYKGLRSSDYTPYIRDWNTKRLTETVYEAVVSTKMSIVLIEKSIDMQAGRSRILNQISKNEILPSRFAWPNCDTRIDDCYATS